MKEGALIPTKVPYFEDFTADWFLYDKCPYIRAQLARGKSFSRNNADMQRSNLNKHLMPEFEKLKLDKISPKKIEDWLFKLKDKGLANKTVNNNLNTLRVIFNEAERLGIIRENPVQKVKALIKNTKNRGLLSLTEIKELFSDISLWNDNYFIYTMNLLAASTGMRLGEIQALRIENIHDEYIHVCYSYEGGGYGLKGTKTGKVRDVPVPGKVSEMLTKLKKYNQEGYIFSYTNGVTPISNHTVTGCLYKALEKIGINSDERKERNITFHSWRHFFNTTLRSNGVSDSKVQSLTGHSTLEMTEHYTHFKLEDYAEIKDIQERIV